MSTGSDDPIAELEAAAERLERLENDPPVDPDDVDTVANAYESVARVLDRWEERATDWDDFEGYVEFRDDLSETMSSIPEDVPQSDAFLEADGNVKTGAVSKSLTTDDFDAAREALAPAQECADYRDDVAAARRRYRRAYRAVENRYLELDERIDDLERLRQLGEADLDAPVERLRGPIERYDEAVGGAFDEFRRGAPACEFLSFVETAAGYPLVGLRQPPSELLTYVDEAPAGRHSVPKLLEYAEYTKSKLEHYVEDASLLKRRVATNRTYLESLSAEPLCVGWPPPDAETLRYRTEELLSVVGRFAGEETIRALRGVRALTREDEYGRLREAAVARLELTERERERLRSGAVADGLETARAQYQRLADALDSHEPP